PIGIPGCACAVGGRLRFGERRGVAEQCNSGLQANGLGACGGQRRDKAEQAEGHAAGKSHRSCSDRGKRSCYRVRRRDDVTRRTPWHTVGANWRYHVDMTPTERSANHARFVALHGDRSPLVLANAWDAASGRLIEELGAPAVATSSAAVAWARGHADGGVLPRSETLDVVRGMVRVLSIPLSIDIED